ncbi:SCO family protein [Pseudoduganella albidiflava]|uniref:Electron transporter SenC n=1 Tax=Pseudoduganella albidiflava TaxID=321983 RepID=A0A411WXF3_9BURK|nr:SCO family protein [Pseudoduganella albidiflava]QBI01389.1 SCO family protein [Pseudoduganella albidiflava]GGY36038.1 electron transporter SenC [Pseudoduganella albidiflava]
MKILVLALLLCTGTACAQQLKSGVFEPPRAAPEIALPASTGKPFKLTDLRGKVVVLEFGFSHCETVCPVSLAALAEARKLVGPAARDVQVLFISVDPERDTPERLRTYLAQFDPGFIGITGTPAQIAQLLKDYGIAARKHPVGGGSDYSMSHSSYLYFIDRQGRQRAMMPFGRPASEIAHDLAILLKR